VTLIDIEITKTPCGRAI